MCVLENQEGSCSNCGFDKNNYPVDRKKLRVDFILKGQYLVGNVLNGTAYENTYIGWNLNQDSRVVIKEFFPSGLVIREDYSTGNVMVTSDEGGEGYNNVIEEYIKKADEIMQLGGKVEVVDVFRENGTAYYIMPVEEDDYYRLMAFTFVDGKSIDDIVGQARPRKPERVFVQPARSSVKGANYGSSVNTYAGQPTYAPTPEPYVARGSISAHVIQDDRVEYRPETVLPSLHESNREAKEREKEKELERKIEKRIEERLEKQLEERIEKQMVKSGGVFSFGPDGARQPVVQTEQQSDLRVSNNVPSATEEKKVSYTPPIGNVSQTGASAQDTTTNLYRGMISVNGKMVDPNQPKEEVKKPDKVKLSEVKIAGKSLSAIASIAICVVIAILVVTTLISKNGDEGGKNGSGTTSNAASPDESKNKDNTEVVFANAQFEAAVRNALGLSADEVITVSLIEDVKVLDISGQGLVDITDITKFTALKEINLAQNKNVDIGVLAQLTGLTRVDLGGCKLSDVSALSGLSNLEYVNLVGNTIEDYTAVDNVKLVNGRFCKFYFTYVYHREDGKYDGYSLWSWHSGTIGGEYEFTDVPDGSVTTTVEYYVPLTEVGFKIKYKDWVDGMDVGHDRWVSLSQNRYEEQITIHIYNDQEKFQIVYSDGSTAEYGVREADKEGKK